MGSPRLASCPPWSSSWDCSACCCSSAASQRRPVFWSWSLSCCPSDRRSRVSGCTCCIRTRRRCSPSSATTGGRTLARAALDEPTYRRRKISLRVRNVNTTTSKVNDANGNPIQVAAVVVWQVVDTGRATFEVDDPARSRPARDLRREPDDRHRLRCPDERGRQRGDAGALVARRRTQVPLRMSPDLYAVYEAWAADELRSVNAQIEAVLLDAARRAGRLSRGGGRRRTRRRRCGRRRLTCRAGWAPRAPPAQASTTSESRWTTARRRSGVSSPLLRPSMPRTSSAANATSPRATS